MTDFIITGRGLAATVLAHSFYRQGISFRLIGNPQLSSCSSVAAGIWNPVVFKRMTPSWLADELVPCLIEFYGDCEARLGRKFITLREIIKPFTEEQEKVLWKKKALAGLEAFIDPEPHTPGRPELRQCHIPNQYGLVKQSGNLDVPAFMNASAAFFKEHYLEETFEHAALEVLPGKVVYKGMEAKNIIFCEGYLVKDNPWFSWIPLKPAKGEILSILAPELGLGDAIFNKDGFVMRQEEGVYKAGATYAWDDLTQEPTAGGLQELASKIGHMISCGYQVLKHEAGIRPSSADRRPIVGAHPKHGNLFVFNGLGTKGVMLAPYFAGNFVHFYLQKQDIHPTVNLQRFYHFYGK